MVSKITSWGSTVRDICLSFWTGVLRGTRQILFPLSLSFSLQDGFARHPLISCVYQSGQSLEGEEVSQYTEEHSDKAQQLPSIYSGIGVGVYQGEIVVFRRMAIGTQDWVASKLHYLDLGQFPPSILSEVSLLLCLLRLNRTQSNLMKNGLQTKPALALMKSLCPLADNLDKLLTGEEAENNPLIGESQEGQKQQSQCPQICLMLQKCQSRSQSNTDLRNGQQGEKGVADDTP